MKVLPLMILMAACCATGTLLAAEPAPAKPAPTTAPAAKPAESTPPKSDEDSKAKDPGEDEAQPAGKPKPAATAADKASDKASPQRFVPSEQVRADFDVSFPIDI